MINAVFTYFFPETEPDAKLLQQCLQMHCCTCPAEDTSRRRCPQCRYSTTYRHFDGNNGGPTAESTKALPQKRCLVPHRPRRAFYSSSALRTHLASLPRIWHFTGASTIGFLSVRPSRIPSSPGNQLATRFNQCDLFPCGSLVAPIPPPVIIGIVRVKSPISSCQLSTRLTFETFISSAFYSRAMQPVIAATMFNCQSTANRYFHLFPSRVTCHLSFHFTS